jgi:hypothetical protein
VVYHSCHYLSPPPLFANTAVSTHNPPHKQLLVGLGVGALSSSLLLCCLCCHCVVIMSSSLSCHLCCCCCCCPPLLPLYGPWCTHHPPNEQLLVSVGVGAPLNAVIVVIVLSFPFPSPRSPSSVVGHCCCWSSIPCCPTCDPPHGQWAMAH